MKFIVKKIPEYSFSTKHEIQTYDCNPAHAKWFILHALTGLPESWLHSTDFAAEALTLWGESRGLSILFSNQQSALTYLESINSHIDSILRYGTDGKFHPKLIRDDYTVGDLPTIDEDVMLEEPTFNRKSWIDTINEMKVQYSEIIDVERSKPFGPIWGTGYNFYGNLGVGAVAELYIFTELDALNYQKVCCGHQNSIIILSSGALWGSGWNTSGQLGLGDNINRLTFVEINTDSWQDGDGGYNHNMFLKADGTLWGTGNNQYYGQLGLGDYVNRNVLTQCLAAVQKVAAGLYRTLVIKTDGSLWGTGRNDSGQLGLNNLTNRNTFAQEFGNDTDWQLVAGGGDFTMALKINGALYGTGANWAGQLGLNDQANRKVFTQEVGLSSWSKVSCKGYFAIAIKTDGTLWATGRNNHHQLGLGDTTNRKVFTQIGTDSDWRDVFCGSGSTTVMKSSGALWGFGYNQNYSLGLNHTNEVGAPTDLSINVLQTACGASHTVVIKK
jgi:alpha-tubulin suppressor-like RCC1 family protein